MIDKAQAAVSKHCHVQVASVTVSTSVASGTSQTPDGSNASNRGSSLNQAAGAPVLPLQGHKPAQSRSASTRAKGATVYMDSQQHDMYTEIHDRCGSRAFLSQCATTAQQRTASLDPDGSSSGGQHCVPVQRVNSFRRASHHPPGEALPRLMSFTSATGNDTCGAQLDTASDANARLFAHWHIAGCVSGEPACSIVSDGTWGTGGTTASRNPGGASDCTDDTCSIYQEVETVFDMTGVCSTGTAQQGMCLGKRQAANTGRATSKQ